MKERVKGWEFHLSDAFNLQRSERLTDAYRRYRAELDATSVEGEWMPYKWWTLPNPISGTWMIYVEMLGDYAGELANIINDLAHYVRRLRAWAAIIEPMSNDEKLEIAHEFVGMLGVVALGAPSAIKARFVTAAARLCHQAKRAKGPQTWNDDFPTGNLYPRDLDRFGEGWVSYCPFKLTVESISGARFKTETCDFRNSYAHEFSPRLLLGITNSVKRVVNPETKGVSYSFGGTLPLELDTVADLLAAEFKHCHQAFKAFQLLVGEHIEAILAFEAVHANGHNPP